MHIGKAKEGEESTASSF